MVIMTEKSDVASSNEDSILPESSVVENVSNDAENGENGLANNGHTDGNLSNSSGQPGEWESFEVHYVGRGISTVQATNGNESDSSFVSDSDDDQYEGYEPITLQTLQAHTSDSDYTNSEEDIIDGVLPENWNCNESSSVITPRAEHRPITNTLSMPQQNGSSTSKNENEARPSRNDIPLNEERIAEITAAMSGFVLPPHVNMPDDAKLLEMVQRITQP